jgi:cholesterol transport system auxiliary component
MNAIPQKLKLRSGSLLALAAVLLGGCLSKPSIKTESFAFSIPAVTSPPAGVGRVLELRDVKVAAPFDSQSFVYRTGPYSYERDPYAGFLAPPEQTFPAPLRGYFRDSGLFGAVVRPGSSLPANVSLEIYVSELYGDFRNRAAPKAVLRMTFRFFGMRSGLPAALLFEKEYSQAVPFQPRTAAALMGGWNHALQRILSAVTGDLKHVQKPRPPNGHHT